jgi:hypothetical protein
MNEEEINELLRRFPQMRQLVAHLLRRRVDTILNVGGRGYYENPMSDLLAFFLDPSACHGLGDLVLSTLLRSLERNDLNPVLTGAPIREDVNRIDIVLPGENFVIAIENKIRHELNNPFAEYQRTINEKYAQIPQGNRIFCLLAPYQPNPAIAEWQWLDTRRLIALIWEELARRQRNIEHTKWELLLREFLKTVEQELEEGMNDEQFRQVADNYHDLVRFDQLRRQFIDTLKQKLRNLAIPIVGGGDLWARENRWDDAVALSVLPYDNDPRKVSFLLFNGQAPGDLRYAIQVYAQNPLHPEQFAHIHEWQEPVNGVQLHVYRGDYNNLDDALAGFQQALGVILQNHPPPAA